MTGRRDLLNFTYVIAHELAGMALLGVMNSLASDLKFLEEEGIGAIVSLSVMPLDPEALAASGMTYLHVPVQDFAAPTIDQVNAFVGFAETMINVEDRAVAVHCGAGYGRTGTMLACFLVKTGLRADAAVSRVRELRPGSVETPGQEACVFQYQ